MSSEAVLALALAKAPTHGGHDVRVYKQPGRRCAVCITVPDSRVERTCPMIRRPDEMGKFEFAVLASLRAGQLSRGCTARVDGDHTTAVIAQREVSEGKVTHAPAGSMPAVVTEPQGELEAVAPNHR